jgi:hypothetical protein
MSAAWISVIGSAVTAIAAFGSVVLPEPDLEARVTAYASADILRGFRQCRRLLTAPSGQRDTAGDVAWAARILGDDIREELRIGRELSEPLASRLWYEWAGLRGILDSAAGRRHSLRGGRLLEGERLLEQGEDAAFTWRSDGHRASDVPPGEPPP